jgi:transcriptional regulator with XRE-family HTH domain
MKSRQALALNLRRLRVDRGLSQEALAFVAEVDRTYVSGIERGLKNPSLDILDAFAAVFGVTADVLIQRPQKIEPKLQLKSGRKASRRSPKAKTDRNFVQFVVSYYHNMDPC